MLFLANKYQNRPSVLRRGDGGMGQVSPCPQPFELERVPTFEAQNVNYLLP